ncbi:hypothetical protein JG687_00015024 [Phytophthora cactorum]|uniref:Uncharacterized protein n=1 Tax=Phytophthora cactorum TaxID=29920 RepID=A0A8T1TX34_9STRA|nr:hypothetical protein JG687_00015024 [Phytophthora cactorum]
MKLSYVNAIVRLLTPGMFATLAHTRVTERTLFLSTYSDDLSCSNIVYARIDNDICTDTSVCAILNDTDGSFHDSEMTACILDRDEFLKLAFEGSSYFTEWSVDSTTQLNTEACVTDGTNTWKAYFVKGTTVTDDATLNPAATVVTPVSSTPSPAVTTTAPTTNSSTMSSSLATPVSVTSAADLLFWVTLSVIMSL